MKNIKFLSLVSIILFFHGCSNDSKPESSEISETEDILLSYELVEEKSLKHPTLPGAPGEDSKLIDPEAATNIAISTYVDADRFSSGNDNTSSTSHSYVQYGR